MNNMDFLVDILQDLSYVSLLAGSLIISILINVDTILRILRQIVRKSKEEKERATDMDHYE